MFDHPLVLAILPAVIGGLFTLLGVWLGQRLERAKAKPTSVRRYEIAVPDSARRSSQPVDQQGAKRGQILRNAGLILLIQNVTILLGGAALGWDRIQPEDLLILTLMIGVPVLLIGFAVIGVAAGSERWEQLRGVAWLYWLVNALVLLLIGTIDLPLALLSAFPVLLIMGLGGIVARLFDSRSS